MPTTTRRRRNTPFQNTRIFSYVAFLAGLATIIGIVVSSIVNIVNLNANVSYLNKRLDDSEQSLREYSNELRDYASELRKTQSQVDQIIGALSANLRPTGSFSSSMYRQYNDVDAPINDNDNSVTGDSVIVINTITNQELTAHNLEGQKLLLHSSESEDASDSYFYGQVNSDGKWDGDCVFNNYRNGKLTIITEAKYNNGSLVRYRQVFPYITTTYGNKVWAVSDRVVIENNVRSGETYYYYRPHSFECRFDRDNVSVNDIISVEDFVSILTADNIKLEGYYNGNSYSGKFNDNTGDAYLVKYLPEGDVRLFYRGCFSDGQFNDQTGNAWEISYSKEDDFYYLYKDTFTNGHPDTVTVPEEITVHEINQMISSMEISCPLPGWK